MKPFRVIVQTPETDNVITSLTTLSNELAAIGTFVFVINKIRDIKDINMCDLWVKAKYVTDYLKFQTLHYPIGQKIKEVLTGTKRWQSGQLKFRIPAPMIFIGRNTPN